MLGIATMGLVQTVLSMDFTTTGEGSVMVATKVLPSHSFDSQRGNAEL